VTETQDIYSDPGNFETIKNAYGKRVLAIENNNLYLLEMDFTKKRTISIYR
jgi:hypothetical protein